MKERRKTDRRKRTRRYSELTDAELLKRYQNAIIPNDPYVLHLKIKHAFQYTLQVVVAVLIGLAINPETELKTYIVLGLMILINLKYDLPSRIIKWFDK